MKHYDLVIVGGGLCGLSLFRALRCSGLSVLLIDQGDQKITTTTDQRPLVLSHCSMKWFDQVGCWSTLKPQTNMLQTVKITFAGHFGRSVLSAKKLDLQALGYVIKAGELYQQLLPKEPNDHCDYWLKSELVMLEKHNDGYYLNIKRLDGEQRISSACIVAADGAGSTVSRLLGSECRIEGKTKALVIPQLMTQGDYGAQLRMIPEGSMAWLPTARGLGSMVLTCQDDCFAKLRENPPTLLADLQSKWSRHLRLSTQSVDQVIGYQVDHFLRTKLAEPGVFFVGNAAHHLPPIGAQGFNLGCRDVAVLAELFKENRQKQQWSLNSRNLAELYHQRRFSDCQRTYRAVLKLLKQYESWGPITCWGRSVALASIDLLPVLRESVSHLGIGSYE